MSKTLNAYCFALLAVSGTFVEQRCVARADSEIQIVAPTPGTSVLHADGTQTNASGTERLAPTDTVTTGRGTATIAFSDGTRLNLQNNTRVTLRGSSGHNAFAIILKYGKVQLTSPSTSPVRTYTLAASISTIFFHRQSGFLATDSSDGGRDLVMCSICAVSSSNCRANDFYVVDGGGNCEPMKAHMIVSVDAAHGIAANLMEPVAFARSYVAAVASPYAGNAFAASNSGEGVRANTSLFRALHSLPTAQNLDVNNVVLRPNSSITIDPKSLGKSGALQALPTNSTIRVRQNANGTTTLIAGPNAHGGAVLIDPHGNFGIVKIEPPSTKQ